MSGMHVLRSLVSVALFAVTLTSVADAQKQLLDDFSSGTDAKWTHEDQLLAGGLGPTSYQVIGGKYQISGTVPSLSFQVGTGSWYSASLASPADFSDGVLEATVRIDGTNNAIILFRSSAQLDGYVFVLSAQYDSITIERAVKGFSVEILGKAGMTVDLAKEYRVKGSFIGDQLTMKAWDATAAEPAQPQIAITNTAYSSGPLGVGVVSLSGMVSPMVGTYDDVYFTPCGQVVSYGAGCVGSNGLIPSLTIDGCVSEGETFTLGVSDGLGFSAALLFVGVGQAAIPVGTGCTFDVAPPLVMGVLPLDGAGAVSLPVTVPLALPPAVIDMQAWVIDGFTPIGAAGSNALEVEVP